MSITRQELIGGPLDGMVVDLDISIEHPHFHSLRLLCSTFSLDDDGEEVDTEQTVVIYRVEEWRLGQKALVFDRYEN